MFISAQDYSVFLTDELGDLIEDVVIAEVQSLSWMSHENGVLSIPDSALELHLVSLTYIDTTLYVRSGDTVQLRMDADALNEVVVFGNQETKSVRHRRHGKELQREPGDIRMLGYYSEEDVILDSLQIYIVEVLRTSARFRVVLYTKDTIPLFASTAFSIDSSIKDEYYSLPVGYFSPIKGEFYLGIQFLEIGRDPFNWTSHLYQYRRRGTYTVHNNGITIGSIKLKKGERLMTAEYFHGDSVLWWKSECDDIRFTVPYFKVFYHGSGELLTDFDDIED